VPFPATLSPQPFEPAGAGHHGLFPLPNTSSNGTTYGNNYDASGDVAITGNLWNTRWDYYLNQKNSIFGRYSYAAYTEQAPAPSAWKPAAPTSATTRATPAH
jgi:hypothetical protein